MFIHYQAVSYQSSVDIITDVGYLLIRSVAFRDVHGVLARLPEEQLHHGFVVGPQRFKELAHNASCKLPQFLQTTIASLSLVYVFQIGERTA